MLLKEIEILTNHLLVEELTADERKKYKKLFNSQRYDHLFNGKTRLFFPVGEQDQASEYKKDIEQFLQAQGYTINDYEKGLLNKEGDNRVFKIGKVLNKLNPALLKLYQEDPSRQPNYKAKQAEYYVVISRNSYDIASMSTDRPWNSCMNIRTGINKRYVTCDVSEGTLVSYLVSGNEIQNERDKGKRHLNAIGRLSIKPFINTETNQTVLIPERNVYGRGANVLKNVVNSWLSSVNTIEEGEYRLIQNLYADSIGRTIRFSEVDKYKYVIDVLKSMVQKSMIDAIKKDQIKWQVASWVQEIEGADIEIHNFELINKNVKDISIAPNDTYNIESEYLTGIEKKVELDRKKIERTISAVPDELKAEVLSESGVKTEEGGYYTDTLQEVAHFYGTVPTDKFTEAIKIYVEIEDAINYFYSRSENHDFIKQILDGEFVIEYYEPVGSVEEIFEILSEKTLEAIKEKLSENNPNWEEEYETILEAIKEDEEISSDIVWGYTNAAESALQSYYYDTIINDLKYVAGATEIIWRGSMLFLEIDKNNIVYDNWLEEFVDEDGNWQTDIFEVINAEDENQSLLLPDDRQVYAPPSEEDVNDSIMARIY